MELPGNLPSVTRLNSVYFLMREITLNRVQRILKTDFPRISNDAE